MPVDNRPAATGLATYPLLERRSAGLGHNGGLSTSSKTLGGAAGSHTWLASCVRHIASSVVGSPAGRGPTLQLVYSSNGQHRFEAVPISSALADDPQNWSQFATHVRDSGANGLVLVRPIESPEQHCALTTARPHPTAAASSSSASSSSAGPSPAAAPSHACDPPCTPAAGPSPSPSSSLDGHVGDCCDGTGPASAATAALATPLAPAIHANSGHDSCAPRPTQYFGLVVQGSCSSEADGCWVLKTTRSDSGASGSGACSCVHFSLTRVCYGQPLYEQLRNAWLVPQSAAAGSGRA